MDLLPSGNPNGFLLTQALGGQLAAGAQASPLLQQLIAANAAVSAEGGVAPAPLLPGVPQVASLTCVWSLHHVPCVTASTRLLPSDSY